MNEREIATLKTAVDIVDLCERKSADFENVPMFNPLITRLKVITVDIRQQSQILEVNTQGYTRAKNASKEALILILQPILKKVQAFASITNDEVLKNAVKYSHTEILKIRESIFTTICREILQKCQERLPDLIPYGNTQEGLMALSEAIADFEARMAGTPQYRGEQKAARLMMEKDFDEMNDIINNRLDMLIEIIQDTNPTTYVEYQNARRVDVNGSRTLSLKGFILESATGQPIEGATVTIIQNGNGDGKAGNTELSKSVKKSAARGGFRINSLPAGTYTVIASKVGYTEQRTTVYINDREMSTVELGLERL